MKRRSAHAFWLAVLFFGSITRGSNIDPLNNGAKYAWSENLGWLNCKPGGDSGQGVTISDFELAGWIWSENAGWISLSCKNTSSCATKPYGVTNDEHGHLGGYAWGENIGWINFAPTGGGVTVDPSTGSLDGHAWAENAGWISFSGGPPNPFTMITGWRCDPTLPRPTQAPSLSLSKTAGEVGLAWTSIPLATGYDVVKGDINALRSSAGVFGPSTVRCLANNSTGLTTADSDAAPPNDGFWYLVRGANCGGSGTYDSGQPSQVRSRDAGIAGSGNDCNFGPGIVFDKATASNDLIPTIGSPTVSYSHTLGAGLAKSVLLVFVSGKQGTGNPVANCRATSVTYGGTALTSTGFGTATDSSDFKTVVEAWYLVSPSAGVNAVQMTFPNGCPVIQSSAISLWNVDQSAPILATAVSTITASQTCAVATTVVPSTGGWAVDAFGYNRSNDGNPQFVDQIERVDHHSANGSLESSTRPVGGATTSMRWNVGAATCSRAVHLVVTVAPP